MGQTHSRGARRTVAVNMGQRGFLMKRFLSMLGAFLVMCSLLAMIMPEDGRHWEFLKRYFASAPFDACQSPTITVPPTAFSLNTAVAALGSASSTLEIGCTLPVTANVVVPLNITVRIRKPGILTASAPVTVTFYGPFEAARYKVFDANITVLFAVVPPSSDAYPEWWQDNTVQGTTDMTSAINSALATGKAVSLDQGTYQVTELTAPLPDPDIYGKGTYKTIIRSAFAGKVLRIAGGQRCRLRDFAIDGSDVANYGIYMEDSSCIEGILRRISVQHNKGNPGIGIFTVGPNNHSLVFDTVRAILNKTGVKLGPIAYQMQFLMPYFYSNSVYNLDLSDGGGSILLRGGLIELANPDGVANINVGLLQPLIIDGTYFESGTTSTSTDILVTAGPAEIHMTGTSHSGRNVANKAMIINAQTFLTIINGHFRNYLQYPIGPFPESPYPAGTCINIVGGGGIIQVVGGLPFYTNCPMNVGVNPTLTTFLIGNLTVGGDTDARVVISENLGQNGNTSGLLLGAGGTPYLQLKGGVIFEKTGAFAVGKLHLLNNGTADNSNATVADSKAYIDTNGNYIYKGVAFSALGTPSNGATQYCSDCTIANPCASGGSGAFAKRLNGAWVCN